MKAPQKKKQNHHIIQLITSRYISRTVKNLPAMRKTWVRTLGWEDPLEEGMATNTSILAWRIPMDRGAWWVMVYRVSKSQIQLSD